MGGGGAEHACVCIPESVCVSLSVCGCVHLDGQLDDYLQVLPWKTKVDIQKTKRSVECHR